MDDHQAWGMIYRDLIFKALAYESGTSQPMAYGRLVKLEVPFAAQRGSFAAGWGETHGKSTRKAMEKPWENPKS